MNVQRGDERGDGPGQPRQWVIQRVKLQKVHLQACQIGHFMANFEKFGHF